MLSLRILSFPLEATGAHLPENASRTHRAPLLWDRVHTSVEGKVVQSNFRNLSSGMPPSLTVRLFSTGIAGGQSWVLLPLTSFCPASAPGKPQNP